MKKKLLIPLILLALSIPSIISLLVPGFYEPHDLHHFADIYQMYRAFISGQFPPRMGPDFTFGYGYPLFNFYYVLPFYLGSLFFALMGSLQLSFELVFIVSIIVSVFGMYLFLREFVDKWAAVVGSTLFVYTPYRAVQLYVRGAMGEALALSILPLVLWSIVRLLNKKSHKYIAITSLITAFFILSHNYLWALALPFILLLVFLTIDKKKYVPTLKVLIFTGLLSAGLTSYWWLPALLENKLVAAVTPFPLIDHFPFIKQLIIPSWGYGSSLWGPGDEISFQIGLVNLLVVVAVAIVLVIKKFTVKRELLILSIWALLGFLISVVLMNSRTYFLWKFIPFHNFIQFPWRLLIFTTLFSATLAAILVQILGKNIKKYIAALIIGGSLLLTYSYFQPSKIVYKNDSLYLTRFFESKNYSEDYLLLPNWTDERPGGFPQDKIESNEAKVLNIKQMSLVFWQADILAEKQAIVTFNSYYFPGWVAKVDGEEKDIKPGKPYGQIELDVPEGNHKVEFYWQETPLRKFSDYISLVSLLVLGFLFVKKKQSDNAKKQK